MNKVEMVTVRVVDQVTGEEERRRMWKEREELHKEEEEGEGKE